MITTHKTELAALRAATKLKGRVSIIKVYQIYQLHPYYKYHLCSGRDYVNYPTKSQLVYQGIGKYAIAKEVKPAPIETPGSPAWLRALSKQFAGEAKAGLIAAADKIENEAMLRMVHRGY